MYYIEFPDEKTILKYKLAFKDGVVTYKDNTLILKYSVKDLKLVVADSFSGTKKCVSMGDLTKEFNCNDIVNLYMSRMSEITICDLDCFSPYLHFAFDTRIGREYQHGYYIDDEHVLMYGRREVLNWSYAYDGKMRVVGLSSDSKRLVIANLEDKLTEISADGKAVMTNFAKLQLYDRGRLVNSKDEIVFSKKNHNELSKVVRSMLCTI